VSLRGQPGYDPIDLRTIVPLADVSDPGEGGNPDWQPIEGFSSLEVISRKLSRQQVFREGMPVTTIAYNLYADHRKGITFPITENHRIWHPDDSENNPDGTPNLRTAFDITSVVTYDREGIAQIACQRSTGS
jgi:hypothetical protein